MDEIVIEREVDGLTDIKGEIIERSDEGKNPGEEGADENSTDGVPDKEFVDAGFAGVAFFPSDFGVENIGENSGGGGGNQGI